MFEKDCEVSYLEVQSGLISSSKLAGSPNMPSWQLVTNHFFIFHYLLSFAARCDRRRKLVHTLSCESFESRSSKIAGSVCFVLLDSFHSIDFIKL
jgi:hypothetical protein